MKKLIQIVFRLAVLLYITNGNPIQAQGEFVQFFVSNPSCCPSSGTAGGTHSTIGPSNITNFNGNGTFIVYISWDDAFPFGAYNLLLWAETETVDVEGRGYDAMKCYGDAYLELSGSVQVTPTITLSPIYIYNQEIPD